MGFKLVPKKNWKGDTEYELKDSSSDSTGALVLAGLIAFIAFLAMNAHWILMGAGGAAGAWIGEKISSKTLQDHENNTSPLSALLILGLSIAGGGFGFVQGNHLRAYLQESTKTPQQTTPRTEEAKSPPTIPNSSPPISTNQDSSQPQPDSASTKSEDKQNSSDSYSDIPSYSEYQHAEQGSKTQEDQSASQEPETGLNKAFN